jgi:CBS domain-containing protein
MVKPKLGPARHFLGWFPQLLKLGSSRIRGQVRLLGFAALVGIVAGLGGIAFYIATRVVEHYALGVWAGYYPQPHPGGEPSFAWLAVAKHPFHPWLLLLIPTLGGIVSGLLVFTLAPEAEGHGTDAVIAAYHYRQGQIRPRVPLVKIVASAITLGTGGSGGREGPIAQIGAGFGSLLANLFRMRAVDRRILMAAGMGAGIAAIFRAPLAGTMFAAEVLYRSPEFESEVIMPAGIASVVSYCIFGAYTGWEPLFTIPNLAFSGPLELGPYLLLAGVRVNEFLSPQRNPTVLHPGDSLDTVINQLDAAPHAILPVVDAHSRLLGVVNLEEVYLASGEPALKPLILAEDLMRTDVRPLTPDDTLDHVQELFVENDLLALPVVNDHKHREVLGMIQRHEIAGAYLRRLHGPVSTE